MINISGACDNYFYKTFLVIKFYDVMELKEEVW